MQVSTDMLRGYTDVILLAQLDRGDSYGYAITRSDAQASQHAYEIKDSSDWRRRDSSGPTGARRHTAAGADILPLRRRAWTSYARNAKGGRIPRQS